MSDPQAEDPTDSALVSAFVAGDLSAFPRLIERHQRALFHLLRRYTHTREDLRDLAQRALLQAYEAARQRPAHLNAVPFKPWLFRIALNLGKNHLRGQRRWPLVPVTALDGKTHEVETDVLLERAEVEALTRRAVLDLPERQREVFTLRLDAGLSFAEIGVALGITESNAKSNFHHALRQLKQVVGSQLTPKERP